jgi:predicted RNase H-like nuclease
MSERGVLGVDACSGGWVGICISPHGVSGHFAAGIAELVAAFKEESLLEVVAVDMPIGLADTGPRAPDVLARRLVGARASSVFSTPLRPALEAATRAEADAVHRRLTGKGVSAQAFALKEKLFEVDHWARGHAGQVVEVHPEVSFAQLAGPVLEPKRSWTGQRQRHRLLAEAGLRVPENIGIAGIRADSDDVLDAAVAAWTAGRVATGQAVSYPDPPVTYADGWPCAIWA